MIPLTSITKNTKEHLVSIKNSKATIKKYVECLKNINALHNDGLIHLHSIDIPSKALKSSAKNIKVTLRTEQYDTTLYEYIIKNYVAYDNKYNLEILNMLINLLENLNKLRVSSVDIPSKEELKLRYESRDALKIIIQPKSIIAYKGIQYHKLKLFEYDPKYKVYLVTDVITYIIDDLLKILDEYDHYRFKGLIYETGIENIDDLVSVLKLEKNRLESIL